MSQAQTNDTLREWRQSAPSWAKHNSTIRTMFAPITEALVQAAAIVQGQLVLDVAGGPGEPSLTIADVVAPTGSVFCTDVVAGMVAAAKVEALHRRVTRVQFCQCSADALPFTNDMFDVTVSRLGAMFFPDPETAFRAMLFVTKPGGVLAFAVWHKSALNPFCSIVTEITARHVAAPAADPDAPGAFRFAELGKLARLLSRAGAVDVKERVLEFRIQAPISPVEYWQLRYETSPTLAEKLASLSIEERTQLAAEVQDEVSEFFPNDKMNFPAQVLVVTGRKR